MLPSEKSAHVADKAEKRKAGDSGAPRSLEGDKGEGEVSSLLPPTEKVSPPLPGDSEPVLPLEPTIPEPEPPLPYAAMLCWNAASVVVILFNKTLYTGPFPHPVTLMVLHMFCNTFFTQALAFFKILEVPALGWPTYLRIVLGLGGLFAGSLACSNLAASRLTVPAVQMIKAVAPLITVAAMFIIGTERYSNSLLTVALLLTLGVGVATTGEAHFDTLGTVLQLTALTIESVRLIAVQFSIQSQLPKSNPLVALSLFAPVAALFLVPLSIILEPGVLLTFLCGGVPHSTVVLVLGNCCAAVALNVCAVWLLSHKSGPLVITVVGVMKDIEIIVFAIFMFASKITHVQVAGYSVALLGLNAYNVLKQSGGGDLSVPDLLLKAVTNVVALVMGLGVAIILAVIS